MVEEVSLFPDQLYVTHCCEQFMSHHWHWLSSECTWRPCYSAQSSRNISL